MYIKTGLSSLTVDNNLFNLSYCNIFVTDILVHSHLNNSCNHLRSGVEEVRCPSQDFFTHVKAIRFRMVEEIGVP